MKVVVRCDKFEQGIFRPSNERDEKEVFLANFRDESVIETLNSKSLHDSLLALPEADKSVIADAINSGVCISQVGKISAFDHELKAGEPLSQFLRKPAFTETSKMRKSPIVEGDSAQSIFARKLDPILPLAKAMRIVDRYFLKNLIQGRENGTEYFLQQVFKSQVPSLEIITTDLEYFENNQGRRTGQVDPNYDLERRQKQISGLLSSMKSRLNSNTSVNVLALKLNSHVFPHDRYGEIQFQVNRLGFVLGKGAETFFGENAKGIRILEPVSSSLEIDKLTKVTTLFSFCV
jgi:hypothetical protein